MMIKKPPIDIISNTGISVRTHLASFYCNHHFEIEQINIYSRSLRNHSFRGMYCNNKSSNCTLVPRAHAQLYHF